MLTAQWRHL